MLMYLDVISGKLVEASKEPEKNQQEATAINAINSEEILEE